MMGSTTQWDGHHQHMAPAPDDDFNQFLDMSSMGAMADGMQFDFAGFQDGTQGPANDQQSLIGPHHQHHQNLNHTQRSHQDAIMTDSDGSSMIPRTSAPGHSIMPVQTPPISAGPQPSIPATHMMGLAHQQQPGETISNIDAQIQYLQQQKFNHQQRQMQEQQAAFYSSAASGGNNPVPPTPQSIELPPGSGHFYSQADMYDGHRGHGMNDQQDMAFTPLVSPAVTPLEPHFNVESAFAIPGAYFSPLTSPALLAQTDSSSIYDNSTHSNNSPIEMDLEAPATTVPAASMDLSKKARKNNAAKARAPRMNVKNSPISKPQRRKTGPSPAMVSQVLSEVQEQGISANIQSRLPPPAATIDGPEENASVSPENLTDMPPPPVPNRRSTSKSPYIQAQKNGKAASPASTALLVDEQQPHPATPASLMKLPASKSKKTTASPQQEATATDNIESLELPDPVSARPIAPRNTNIASPSVTIDPSSAKTMPVQQPLPSPNMRPSSSASATQSPQLLPGASTPTARKTPQFGPRNSRHRSSNSVHVSPALLPKISPNIKPLLPGGPGMSPADDTASRLLMTKSNYQNIIEGNLLPGVTYPAELSTNLTSKRTSHKIAEQGRRNRINSALQVMAGLLPEHQQVKLSDDGDGKKDSKQANAQNSKASVVENAIVHMKHLTQENSDLKQQLEELRKKVQEMGKQDA
jgi:hypothetical protein